MYLTAHALNRILPADFAHAQGWPAQILELLPGQPVAWWAGAQLGSSAGTMIAVWADETDARAAAQSEGSTGSRVTMDPARAYRLHRIEPSTAAATAPRVVQLTWFDGPRTAAHLRADDLADRRVADALADLPDLCGAVLCLGDDNARLVLSFADTEQTLRAALGRIMSTKLGPDEDPALLTGPDAVQIFAVVAGTGSLQDAGLAAEHAGGVR